MPPQPLSRVRPNTTIELNFAFPANYPHFAEAIVQVIHYWANADVFLSHMVSRFLKADFEIVTAMFQALVSAEARRDALLAAAKETLPKDDYNLLRSVLKIAKPSRDRRNEFVHHIWGTCPQIPDALILADPRVLNQAMIDMNRSIVETGQVSTGGKPTEYDHSRIYVYRRTDFDGEVEAARSSMANLAALHVAIGAQAPGRDTMRTALLNQPPIQQQFQKFSNEDNPQPPP